MKTANQVENLEINSVSQLPIHPVEEMPRLKYGTNKDLLKIIMSKLTYPQEHCYGGTTVIAFIVNKKGKVENPQIKRSICSKIDQQLFEIIKDIEFIPGKLEGKEVPFTMTLPIKICIR